MPRINGERLLGDLRRIADFGRYQTGVHRPHLSPQDVESRRWLAGRMKEAGLEPVIDGVGNVIGRSPKTGPRLLMGSQWRGHSPRTRTRRTSPSTSPRGPTRRAIGAA